jgi:serine/threonine protein kinase/tetratricopeptide (TPR) repeat protein
VEFAPFHVGEFRLTSVLGRGAFSVVYDAVHVASGFPVAVKVVRVDGEVARVQAAFRDEVRAVARLDHPGVVLVFESGTVDDAEAVASGGRVEAGSPWLAMERAARGTLESLDETMPWRDIKGILAALLAALAHAHARGVLHRDIKPANVLLGSPDDFRPAVRIADFGLAFALELGAPGQRGCGTPAFMAPEQVDGRWRAFSAGTDLYGVGCIAWALVTGAPPFGGDSVDVILAKQRQAPLPPLRPRMGVPVGLEPWLRRMLAKSPADRFACAADAAWGLDLLSAELSAAFFSSSPPPPALPAVTLDFMLDDADDPAPATVLRDPDAELVAVVMPAIPNTWRPARPPIPVPQLGGTGLSLWGLRASPLTGRDGLLDAAWAVLVDAARSEQLRAVTLRGEPGVGKSRLAQEVAERAGELGVVTVLKVTHGSTPGATDGLVGMLARRFATAGLSPSGVLAHLLAELGPVGLGALEVAAIAAIIAGESASPMRPLERWVVLRRLLVALARVRTVFLWIDDAQWGREAVEFAAWLLGTEPLPCMVMVTCHPNVADDDVRRAVLALEQDAKTTALGVLPLQANDAERLCGHLLGLAPALAQRVAALSGGNPLFLQQILGAWVTRGDLVATADGRHGSQADEGRWELVGEGAPASLQDAWAVRLESAIPAAREHLPDLTVQDFSRFIAAAAVLGDRVQGDEWEALAQELGLGSTGFLLGALVGARLALPEPGGWSFAHGLLREAVLSRTPDVDVLHAAAADVLSRRGAALRRVAAHQAAAGRPLAAADTELRAAVRLCESHEVLEASAFFDRAASHLDAAAVPHVDARRVELVLVGVRIAELRGLYEEAVALSARCIEQAREVGAADLEARVRLVHANALRGAGQLPEALLALDTARKAAATCDGNTILGQVELAIGRVQVLRGQLDAATLHLQAAVELAASGADYSTEAEAIGRLGDVARQRGDQVLAAQFFEAAILRYRSIGNVGGESMQQHGLAEAHRLSGRLEEAEAGYLRTISMDVAAGKDPSIPEFNLALCRVARGQIEQAEQVFRKLVARWGRVGGPEMLAFAWCGILCAASLRGDAAVADEALCALPAALTGGAVDIDLAQLTGDAARAWGSRDDRVRAAACAAFAVAQWRALGAPEEVAALLEAVGG